MSETQGAAQRNGDGRRRLNPFWMAVLWLVVIVLAFDVRERQLGVTP
jgi:hypothetical protein